VAIAAPLLVFRTQKLVKNNNTNKQSCLNFIDVPFDFCQFLVITIKLTCEKAYLFALARDHFSSIRSGNAFSHGCDITCETFADRAKNTEG